MSGWRAIAAVAEDWSIGQGGELLFHIPEDLRHFRALTEGQIVVMGRRTLESLPGGKPLRNRTNYVLSRQPGLEIEGAAVCGSIEELRAALDGANAQKVYVIGGESVYRLCLTFCDTVFITKVHAKAPADRYFPNLDESPEWECASSEEHTAQNGLRYEFCTYRRRAVLR